MRSEMGLTCSNNGLVEPKKIITNFKITVIYLFKTKRRFVFIFVLSKTTKEK